MSKFEAILPLTPNQNALLTHHIISEDDLGEIWVEFKVLGAIDKNLFLQAYNRLNSLNPSLRTTIHWEKIDHPVQIVHFPKELEIVWHDQIEEVEFLKSIQKSELGKSEVISKYPRTTVFINHLEEKQFQVTWRIHHIFLDGWSTANLINQWAELYNGLVQENLEYKTQQKSLKQYIDFLKSESSEAMLSLKLNPASSRTYKRLFPQNKKLKHPLIRKEQSISSSNLNDKCVELEISLASMIKSSFSLCLHTSFGLNTMVYGLSTSGRTTSNPEINSIVGMVSGLVPVFSTTERKEQSLKDFLKVIHKQSGQELGYSSLSIDQIQSVNSDLDIEASLTIENFPWNDIVLPNISIVDFKSGVTANFHLNLIVIPGENLKLIWLFSENHLNPAQIENLQDNFTNILSSITNDHSVEDIFSSCHPLQFEKKDKLPKAIDKLVQSNNTQFKLIQIWKKHLKVPLDLDDNFFDLGGKSIHIIKIFNDIQKRFGQNLVPASILEYPTVRLLSELIQNESGLTEWHNLVPLSISEKNNYVFCIHAGGAHVFIYRDFANMLSQEASVFGIQAPGLDGIDSEIASIRDMSEIYLNQILDVVEPNSKIFILGYCFSASVILDLGHLIQENNHENIELIVVDSAPGLTYGREILPLTGRVKKMFRIITQGQWRRVRDMIFVKFDRFKAKWLSFFESNQMKNFRKTESKLALLYKHFDWRPIQKRIHLIRSSEFVERSDKNIHVEGWNKLASDHLELYKVNGPHFKLFEKPNVTGLANQIIEIIKDEL